MSENKIPEDVELIEYSTEDSISASPEQEYKKKTKKMKTWKKVLLIILSIILVLAVVLVGGFFYLRASGKKSIYNKASSEGINLVKERETNEEGESYLELEVDPDQMDAVDGMTSENGENTGEQQNSEQETDEAGQSVIVTTTGTVSGSKYQPGTLSIENAKELGIDIETGDGMSYDIVYNGDKYRYNDDMINMLILGIDKNTKVTPAVDGISGGQSDAMFLLTLNPHTYVMDIIAIPRDMIALVDIYDRGGSYVKSGYTQICLQHGYGDGMELSNKRTLKAVSRMLYDLPIHSVTSINMGAVADLNDAVGGVTLKSLHTFSYQGYNFKEGETVTLKGEAAYHYVHYRDTSRHYTAPERLQRQKQYITLFAEKAIQQLKKNVGLVVDVYSIVQDYVVTDIAVNDMTYLGSELINYRFGQIYNIEGEIDTSRKYERFYADQEALYDLLINHFYEKVE